MSPMHPNRTLSHRSLFEFECQVRLRAEPVQDFDGGRDDFRPNAIPWQDQYIGNVATHSYFLEVAAHSWLATCVTEWADAI